MKETSDSEFGVDRTDSGRLSTTREFCRLKVGLAFLLHPDIDLQFSSELSATFWLFPEA